MGISSLQGARWRGAGIGIWNLGIIEFARSAGGRDWNLEFGNFEFEKRLKYQSG